MKNLKYISVKGAKLHNLKNIDVDIPHNSLTVITGVSGSGKSSLAFDTIYAEGQRRFVESLSAYARQFLERMNKPDVDTITGLPPAIAIEQKPPSRNPRSTVGTATEVYDYFRLLFGRIGITICKNCGKTVHKDSADSVIQELLKLDENDKLYILFPLPQQTRNIQSEIDKFREQGFFRVVLNDSDDIIDLQNDKVPSGKSADELFILADRLVLNKEKDTLTRLAESLEAAFNIGPGRIIIRNLTNNKCYYFSKHFECPECEIVYTEPEPRLFSFNIPFGACPNCNGFGRTIDIDENLVIPEKSKSLRQGAIHPFRTPGFSEYLRTLMKLAPKYNISFDDPYDSLPENAKEIIWDGAKDYIGINGFFKYLEENNYKLHYRVMISKYRGYTTCKHCGGSRLRTSARQVFIDGKSIPDLIRMPLNHLLEFVSKIKLSKYNEDVAGQVLIEIKWRLQLLVDIGLHYLSLERLTHTLSGGESQRINLATALGSSLVGTLYVLDEPSIGMHPRDTDRLLDILFKLRNLGNTIIVVEHDLDIIRRADNLIDMGPGAGYNGGDVVFAGKTDEILNNKISLTGKYLSGKLKVPVTEPRKISVSKGITIFNPKKHNLQIPKITFPLNCMTVVTGVSGSGKSTLVHDILYEGLKKIKANSDGASSFYDKIEGAEVLSFIELVDQTPIGKSSRSTPVTYTKVFDLIRDLFSNTQLARQLGLKPGYFSFNVPGGRCEACEGEGQVSVDMQFLPDVHLECEVCKGTRYKREARSVLYKNKSIVDVLDMTIDEAAAFFTDQKKIVKKLKILQDVGLGYIKLGQPSSMLSGGESQRIKLASHLETESTSNTLFIFDEPTTGLHIDDVSKLLKCFQSLIRLGNTIIIIEHNMYVISSADWLIDLGPEAGEDGGRIVATGTPEKISNVKSSYTGRALKQFFEQQI